MQTGFSQRLPNGRRSGLESRLPVRGQQSHIHGALNLQGVGAAGRKGQLGRDGMPVEQKTVGGGEDDSGAGSQRERSLESAARLYVRFSSTRKICA